MQPQLAGSTLQLKSNPILTLVFYPCFAGVKSFRAPTLLCTARGACLLLYMLGNTHQVTDVNDTIAVDIPNYPNAAGA